ncbi:MAG TPA: efflux RND transporter periplasmic adaptor subunit [Planctomycetaceae bacterium]|jgi:multidrug efflux system membrane fusion protein|nr:efflux RND transporter periplasmic adaptor subunit [Planctomycetaceae bacterium]
MTGRLVSGYSSVAGLAAALLCGVLLAGCTHAPAGPPPPGPPAVTVAYPLEQEVADYVDFTGQTAPVKSVDVRARVWGFLQSVNFTEGALVKKGQLLFQIDPRPYQALVNQAKSKIAQDQAQLTHNSETYKRIQQLRQRGAASQEDLDKALADREGMQAALMADTADLETKQLDLDFTRIEAPISGRVSRYEVTEGNVVQSGQNGGTLLTTIVSVDPMYVYFDIDERTLLLVRRQIQSGQLKNVQETAFPIFVGLADEPSFPRPGSVNFMDNKVDPGTGTLRLRANITNTDGMLTPGLFVRCHLPLGAPRRVILVTEQALGSDQGQKFVYVVNDKKEAIYRPVKVGRLYDGLRVIESGLSKTDKVVVIGLQRVQPNTVVEPKVGEMPMRPSATKITGTKVADPKISETKSGEIKVAAPKDGGPKMPEPRGTDPTETGPTETGKPEAGQPAGK